MRYAEGATVWVEDPRFGWEAGTVVVAGDDGGVYVEGSRVPGDSRVMTWSIEPWKVPSMVSPRHESVNGMEDRVRGLMEAVESSLRDGENEAAIIFAERAERLARQVDDRRRELGQTT